ncbi:MAG: phosphoglycerate mutase family protein [Bacteroidota bacterium]
MSTYKIWTTLFIATYILGSFSCDPTRNMTEEELADQKMTTIIMVRHAEKDYGADPLLTDQGTERAERLMEMTKNMDIAAVYSTDTRRTLATARPTAEFHNKRIQIYSAYSLDTFSGLIRRKHRGETVLVVGHSNTTPALASFLDRKNEYPRFSELDYTNFWVINIPVRGEEKLLKLRY